MKYYQETLAVAQRILRELFRRRRSLIFWCIFPVLILLLNGFILQERGQLTTAKAFEYASPMSLVGAALFFSCLGGSVATVVGEREQRTLKRLFISPLSGISYFLGIFLAHSLIALGQTLLVYTISVFLGARFHGSIGLGIAIIILSVIAYVGVGFILGTQLARRTEDVNALVATFGVPLLILGGSFFPSTLFPKKMLDWAQYNPIYHINQALLGVWAEGKELSQISEHFRFILIFAMVMLCTGWLSYQQMLRLEKRL